MFEKMKLIIPSPWYPNPGRTLIKAISKGAGSPFGLGLYCALTLYSFVQGCSNLKKELLNNIEFVENS